jgi:hypothetical protein
MQKQIADVVSKVVQSGVVAKIRKGEELLQTGETTAKAQVGVMSDERDPMKAQLTGESVEASAYKFKVGDRVRVFRKLLRAGTHRVVEPYWKGPLVVKAVSQHGIVAHYPDDADQVVCADVRHVKLWRA